MRIEQIAMANDRLEETLQKQSSLVHVFSREALSVSKEAIITKCGGWSLVSDRRYKKAFFQVTLTIVLKSLFEDSEIIFGYVFVFPNLLLPLPRIC